MKKYKDVVNRVVSKGVFPHQFAFTLLIPLRNVFLSPKKLIQRLGLKEDYNVLEVGPGPGYFSLRVAESIPKGILTMTDIQKEMLEFTKKRLLKKDINNVEFLVCNGIDFPLDSNKFNVIFMVTVLGEIENKESYIDEFYRMLCPGGVLSISEQFGDADKMSVDEIKDLMKNTGFKLDEFYGNKNNFTINFSKE